MPSYTSAPNATFLSARFEVHSDVSYSAAYPTFAWAYLILIDGKLAHLDTGRRGKLAHKGDPETYPVERALKRLRNGDNLPPNLTVYTDSPHRVGGTLVGHDDPWHLVCHYAARDEAQRGRSNCLEGALRERASTFRARVQS